MISARTRLFQLSIAAAAAIVAAAPALAGPATIKLGDIKGESGDKDHGNEIEVLSWSWGAAEASGAADRKAGGGQQEVAADGSLSVASSDPEEGGEVAREPGKLEVPNLRTKTRPSMSDITTVKTSDKGTPVLFSADPQEGGEATKSFMPRAEIKSPRDVATGQATGKRQHKPLTMEKGSLVVTLPEGTCITGARYPTVTFRADDQAYELSDVTVASCTPTTMAKGKKDKAQLDYMIVKMETVLVTG